METRVYRNTAVIHERIGERSEHELGPISPGLIYPEVGEEEMAMWMHWLPTEYSYNAAATYAIKTTLQKLHAPLAVMDEYEFAARLGFHEFAMRSPVRKDARDPLLLGRIGKIWYRIALWGESLLRLEQIRALVDESLVIRDCIARRWSLTRWFGSLFGFLPAIFTFVLLVSGDGDAGRWFVLSVAISSFTWVPTLVFSPENAQHNFLDRYRR